MEDADGALGNEIETGLVVVKLDLGPVDALLVVHVLLQFEDVLVEVELQLLVGIVDAELLKTVQRKVFKAKNIENANRVHLGREKGAGRCCRL